MNDLKRSARTLDTILNILFWLCLVRGIFAAGYHILILCKLFADSGALSGMLDRLTIDWLIIEAAHGFGISLDGAVSMKLVQLLSAVAVTVTACLGIRTLKRVLLPIELGQPFRTGISKDIQSLGKCAFWLGIEENLSMLASVILIERHYPLHSLLLNDTVTGISTEPGFRPAWFIVTAVLAILAMVFRQGEQLQQLADETL